MTGQPACPAADPFWEVMQHFASGVVVVTSGSTPRRGVTVSAFSLVSRNPPLVSVTLRRSSKCLALLKRDASFTVSVLSADQAELARRFADARRDDEQQGEAIWAGLDRLPVLRGALGWLSCEIYKVIGLGDHELLLGSVRTAVSGTGRPLVRFAGKLYSDTLITA
ncbi:MAG TPA: flavin reductase family protein [Streptosporangiaceae bacterium]